MILQVSFKPKSLSSYPVYQVSDVKRVLYPEQPTILLAPGSKTHKHNAFGLIAENSENLNSIPNSSKKHTISNFDELSSNLFFFNWGSLHARLNEQPLQGMKLQEKET